MGATVFEYENPALKLKNLYADRIDVIVSSFLTHQYINKDYSKDAQATLGMSKPFRYAPVKIGFLKSASSAIEKMTAVQLGLYRCQETGEFNEIIRHYYGAAYDTLYQGRP